jgi:hypothetical protein
MGCGRDDIFERLLLKGGVRMRRVRSMSHARARSISAPATPRQFVRETCDARGRGCNFSQHRGFSRRAAD